MKREALLTPHLLQTLTARSKEYTVFDVGRPGLAMRVQPTGARSWIMWERQASERRRITLGKIEDMTLEAARRGFRARKAGAEVPSTPRAAMTFRTLARRFMKAKQGVYQTRTLDCLTAYLDSQPLPTFGKVPLDRIPTPDVAAWFHGYSRTRPGGANQSLTHFTTILKRGKEEGLVPYDLRNPARPIRRNRRAMRGRMLNREQLAQLFVVLAPSAASVSRCSEVY